MGNWLGRSLILFHFISQANAAVIVDAVPAAGEWEAAVKKGLDGLILSGGANAWNLRFRVEGNVERFARFLEKDKEGATVLRITDESYRLFGQAEKETALTYLATYHAPEANSVYKISVRTREGNDLTKEPVLVRLGTPFEHLAESVTAESLLSSYAQKWAWRYSDFDGPNCYHTSMASIFKDWDKQRYMGPKELMCHQKTYLEPIEKPEAWGDMISFNDANDVPIHAFTYLGVDRNNPNRSLVFTKNGYLRSRFLFMSYGAVYSIYQDYGIRHIRYYRPKAQSTPIDPAAVPQSPCYREYYYKWEKARAWEADPVLFGGIKRKPTESFAPIVIR